MSYQSEVPKDYRSEAEVQRTKMVSIVAEVSQPVAIQLGFFVQSVTLETLMAHTDSTLTLAQREEQARMIRDGLEAVIAGIRV